MLLYQSSRIYSQLFENPEFTTIYAPRKKRETETTEDCKVPVMINLLEGQHSCISEIRDFCFQPKNVKFGISQNPRIAEVRRGLGRSSYSNPLLRQGHLEHGNPEPSSDNF